ncbi:MAG: efflux RND transporter periplasmic adaptor subunit, partial [Verrucomicrobiota bacterium]|nr:efflux RND transporter periplasmic adaptor subunit [Verrucomicrobiota bacterium]
CAGLGWLAREAAPERQAGPAAAGAPGPVGRAAPKVSVHAVEERPLNPPFEYIARVEPIQDVELRAQIDGYVHAVHFKEGAIVKAGDLLFTIDPEQYDARVAVRKAEIGVAEANLDRADRLLSRLEASDKRAVIPADLDKARSDVAAAKATISQAKANLTLAEIDLKHTKIIAPIGGRVGRTTANVGDYVAPSIGTLVRIVQVNPIRVAFSVTDKDYVRVREGIENENIEDTLRFRVKLPTGTVPDILGRRDFEDNTMSADTATISSRIRFDNERDLLVPDAYVTMLVDFKNPKPVPVVPQEAVISDKDGTFVYVIDGQNTAHLRRVDLGALESGLVGVLKGVTLGEKVVTLGVQKLTPGLVVEPSEDTGAAPAPASDKESVKK